MTINALNSQSVYASLNAERLGSAENRSEQRQNSVAVKGGKAVEQEQNTVQASYEQVYAKAQSLFASPAHSSSKTAAYDAVSKQLGRQTAQEWLSFSAYA